MWWKGIILIWAIGVTNFTVMDRVEDNADIVRKGYEEVLIFELGPKIMNVLKKEYDNYLFGGAHIIPIRKTDSFPQQEFILEGIVTKQDSSSDIVRITFKASSDGYKVSNFHVIQNVNI